MAAPRPSYYAPSLDETVMAYTVRGINGKNERLRKRTRDMQHSMLDNFELYQTPTQGTFGRYGGNALESHGGGMSTLSGAYRTPSDGLYHPVQGLSLQHYQGGSASAMYGGALSGGALTPGMASSVIQKRLRKLAQDKAYYEQSGLAAEAAADRGPGAQIDPVEVVGIPGRGVPSQGSYAAQASVGSGTVYNAAARFITGIYNKTPDALNNMEDVLDDYGYALEPDDAEKIQKALFSKMTTLSDDDPYKQRLDRLVVMLRVNKKLGRQGINANIRRNVIAPRLQEFQPFMDEKAIQKIEQEVKTEAASAPPDTPGGTSTALSTPGGTPTAFGTPGPAPPGATPTPSGIPAPPYPSSAPDPQMATQGRTISFAETPPQIREYEQVLLAHIRKDSEGRWIPKTPVPMTFPPTPPAAAPLAAAPSATRSPTVDDYLAQIDKLRADRFDWGPMEPDQRDMAADAIRRLMEESNENVLERLQAQEKQKEAQLYEELQARATAGAEEGQSERDDGWDESWKRARDALSAAQTRVSAINKATERTRAVASETVPEDDEMPPLEALPAAAATPAAAAEVAAVADTSSTLPTPPSETLADDDDDDGEQAFADVANAIPDLAGEAADELGAEYGTAPAADPFSLENLDIDGGPDTAAAELPPPTPARAPATPGDGAVAETPAGPDISEGDGDEPDEDEETTAASASNPAFGTFPAPEGNNTGPYSKTAVNNMTKPVLMAALGYTKEQRAKAKKDYPGIRELKARAKAMWNLPDSPHKKDRTPPVTRSKLRNQITSP